MKKILTAVELQYFIPVQGLAHKCKYNAGFSTCSSKGNYSSLYFNQIALKSSKIIWGVKPTNPLCYSQYSGILFPSLSYACLWFWGQPNMCTQQQNLTLAGD